MGETDAIVGIYGAVDRAVQADPDARARVAQLLPHYRNPELRWYDDFLEWLSGTPVADSSGPAFPDVGDALTQLAQIAPECRMRARRLFAIQVATRAFPQMRERDNPLRSRAVDALRASFGKTKASGDTKGRGKSTTSRSSSTAESGRKAEDLYRLLAGEDHPDSFDAARAPEGSGGWNELVATAEAKGLIADTTGMLPQPCSGRLVSVPGVTGPVATLETEVETNEIDFDAATRFIEPVNWVTCMPNFWCDVHVIPDGRLPPGQRLYHEVVSTHCGDKARAGFWAETDLLFNFMWLPDKVKPEVALTNYQLADGRPLPHDLIRVDEGTLVVSKVGEGQRPLRITTTKRIKFSYPFISEALAVMMCAFGYADVAGDLLCCAATRGRDPGDKAAVGTDFPGVSPTAAAPDSATGSATGYAATSPGGYGQGPLGGLVQDMVDIWTGVLRDGAAAIERGVGGARKGGAGKTPGQSEG